VVVTADVESVGAVAATPVREKDLKYYTCWPKKIMDSLYDFLI
jgi:hypothetical protein